MLTKLDLIPGIRNTVHDRPTTRTINMNLKHKVWAVGEYHILAPGIIIVIHDASRGDGEATSSQVRLGTGGRFGGSRKSMAWTDEHTKEEKREK